VLHASTLHLLHKSGCTDAAIIDKRFARWSDEASFAFHTEANSTAFELASGIMPSVER
jgi:hypothetical protein